ncbi:MAG: S8 family serine peptidase [Rhodobacterales bacterium]|nr:S8 family serine peptidase [Rhodobacterales bacterium]
MHRFSLMFAVATIALSSGCTPEQLDALGFEVYIVSLNKDGSEVSASVQDLADELGFDAIHVYQKAGQGFSVRLPEELADEVRALPEVKQVVKDKREKRVPDEEMPESTDDVVTDPGVVLGPDEIPPSIDRIGGPYLGSVDLSAIHVAVIDTGIDSAHPDLNVVGFHDVVAIGGGTAAEGQDPNGHGTHVAGTIGARADGVGVVGMAPDIPLHGVRVLDENGSGYTSDIVAGLEYVLDHPEIRVVNMSLGGGVVSGYDPMAEAIEALEATGVVVVIAAGNEAQDTENVSPAGYDMGIVVSAYDADGGDNGFASFSNYGDAVDVAAPGVSIFSTWPGGDFAELDGTSMAAPAVAGAVAVYMAINPNAGVTKVRNAVTNTGVDNYAGQGGDHTEVFIDAQTLWNEG